MNQPLLNRMAQAVFDVETELKVREEEILNLRVRIRGLSHNIGANCYLCSHLDKLETDFCRECSNHEKFKFVFE